MNYNLERKTREAIVEVCHRMWQKGFISATDGNVSVRLSHNRIMATPSGMGKGFLKPDELVIITADGYSLCGRHKVTTEMLMHLAAYEERPDIGSVVHAHPPLAIAFSIAGEEIPAEVLPEVIVNLKCIPIVPYATPGTQAAGDAIRPYIRSYDAIMMDRHGSVTVGSDIFEAYYKLEKLEHAAHIILTAKLLGRVQTLSPDQLRALFAHHGY